jgi:dihydrofolate reductase
MRKIVVLSFISLDGVMQAPGGPEEDPTGGFAHGGWVAGYWDDVLGEVMGEQMTEPFELLLGRRTYEIFAAHWPYVKNDPFADTMNEARKYVVTRTMGSPNWKNSVMITGDVVDRFRELKELDGPELQVHGSGNLVHTLMENDLIDRFHLKIFPVILGSGKKLFAEGAVAASFRLLNTQTTTKGVIAAAYERDGAVKTGSFALEDPTDAELQRRRLLAMEVEK